MVIDCELKQIAESEGIDFFGVADLTSAWEAICLEDRATHLKYPRAISVGIALLSSIVDQLPQREDPVVAMSYKYHAYEVVNRRLDLATSRLSRSLERAGHAALPIAASQQVHRERLLGAFSHKMAAHLAGLGWIGKSCLLVTPEVGPRVRWATVLTDAMLTVTGEPLEQQCGDCQECVDMCPAAAFTGRAFDASEPRSARFAVQACDEYQSQMRDVLGVSVCGLCVYVCPHGKREAE